MSLPRTLLRCLATLIGLTAAGHSWAAPIVWSGAPIAFSKPSGADPTLPQNQDFLTTQVRLTRGNTQGIFNIALESAYAPTSPADTEWATDLNNPSQLISAANFAALTFSAWQAAYNNSPTNFAVGRKAVVHLIRDDVYLDLRFTSFQGGTAGGAFAWERSTPVPEPALGLPAALVGAWIAARRSCRSRAV